LTTYGEPRVGNPAFSSWFKSVIEANRVVHQGDIVPHIPLSAQGFLHQGQEVWYDGAMKTYKICPDGESPNCSNSLPATSLNTGDHSMSNYIKLPGSFQDIVLNYITSYVNQVLEKFAGESKNLAVETEAKDSVIVAEQ
jgi:hypothetical protein